MNWMSFFWGFQDYYRNEKYWQEYECPRCGLDFDVSPIPLPFSQIQCSCGCSWEAGEHNPNTYGCDELDEDYEPGKSTVMLYPFLEEWKRRNNV